MKKAAAALVAFILLLTAFAVPAAALTDYSEGSDIVYLIEDYDVNITPPDYWMAFTRDDMDEKSLNVLGTTKEKLLQHFEENDIYFEAAHPDKGDIVLSITENDDSQEIYDLAGESKSIVNLIAAAMVKNENEEKGGLTYTNFDLYSIDDVQYIVLDYTDSKDGAKYGTVYYTIVGGIEYRFTLTSCRGTVSEELDNTFKHMVDQTNYMYSYTDNDTFYFDDEYEAPYGYNNWEDYFHDHPEAYDKIIDTAGGFAVAVVIAIIAGLLLFTAVVVVVVILLVKNNNKKKEALQGYVIRTGPDGRTYFYPKNTGVTPPYGAYQAPAASPVPPQQEQSEESAPGTEDAPDDLTHH